MYTCPDRCQHTRFCQPASPCRRCAFITGRLAGWVVRVDLACRDAMRPPIISQKLPGAARSSPRKRYLARAVRTSPTLDRQLGPSCSLPSRQEGSQAALYFFQRASPQGGCTVGKGLKNAPGCKKTGSKRPRDAPPAGREPRRFHNRPHSGFAN